jgi:hypothetical protein
LNLVIQPKPASIGEVVRQYHSVQTIPHFQTEVYRVPPKSNRLYSEFPVQLRKPRPNFFSAYYSGSKSQNSGTGISGSRNDHLIDSGHIAGCERVVSKRR